MLICMAGFMLLEPNEARVMVFFGKYKGTFYETGYWWVNPFMSAKQISIRARNLNVDPIKVNDKTGNPIMIGLVLVWKIKRDDIYKAVFEIDAPTTAGQTGVSASARMNILENFVGVQSDAALRQVAGCYAYDNNGVKDDELTLRSNSEAINDQLEHTLNERLAMAGIGASGQRTYRRTGRGAQGGDGHQPARRALRRRSRAAGSQCRNPSPLI